MASAPPHLPVEAAAGSGEVEEEEVVGVQEEVVEVEEEAADKEVTATTSLKVRSRPGRGPGPAR